MKKFNIQRDYLKKMINGECIVFQEDEDFIYVGDGFVAHKFLKEECFLNLKNEAESIKSLDIKYLLDDTKFNKIDLVLTSDMKIVQNYIVQKLKGENEDNIEVWINTKFLKNFENPTFRGSDGISPVIVFEENEIVGVVLPIRM